MPISLEQWRAAVGRWVARIQRTLIIRRGVKRSPPCASNQERESSLGESHSGERKCMGKRKGRKKYKDDPVNDPAIASDEFYDGVIVLAVPLMSCASTVSKDCSDGNPAGSLKELFGWTVLGAFLVIMLLLLRSGDVEPNPGPAERGTHTLLSISSTPTLHEPGKLTVGHVASQWEEAAPHLMVESCGICKFGSGHLEEASRGALSRWLKDKCGTDIAVKTRCPVLEAQDTSGNIPLAEQLKLFEESSGEAVTGLASPPGVFGTGRKQQYMSPTTTAALYVREHPPGDLGHAASVHTPFGSNEIHGPDGKLAQQGAHTLLSISSTPTLHELGMLAVGHVASQWAEVAPHLVVESCGVCNINGSGHLQEASQGALSRWLKDESETDIAEKTRCPVLEAQEANGNIQLAEQLKLVEESSGEAVTGHASSPGVFGTGRRQQYMSPTTTAAPHVGGRPPGDLGHARPVHTPFGGNEIHSPDVKLAQQDPCRPGSHLIWDLPNESPHFELSVDYLCYQVGGCMKAGPTRSELGCPLSDEVPMAPVGPNRPAHLLPSVDHSTALHAMAIHMVALMTVLLWQLTLLAPVLFTSVLSFLLEVTPANAEKTWWKTGNMGTFFQCQEARGCKCTSMHLLFKCIAVVRRYEHRAMSQQLCDLLAKPYVFLRELLLLAGDVEPNPGPIQAEIVLHIFRDRFISEMDTTAIDMELLHRGIIDKGDQRGIAMELNPDRKNQILHECLIKKCTNDALKTVCDVIIGVPGNPKMTALGKDMMIRLKAEEGARGGRPDESLSSSDSEKQMLQFFKNVEAYNIEMQIVQDNFCKDGKMGFVKLAMAPFKLDFENQQKRFVEAVCDPEGVDKVLTLVKSKVKYEDLPAMVKEFKLLVLSGAPGVGKSTLARKLCQDISKDLKQHGYHLVLLLELRSLISYEGRPDKFQTTHLLEHFSGLMCEGCTPDTMAKLVEREHGKGVLLILDGYDELSAQLRQCPYFHHLLTHSLQSSLHNCDIVLTSRSIVTSEIYHHISKAKPVKHFVNVEVLGFGKTEIKKFARQYFQERDRPDLLDSFLDRLEQFPQMKSLYSNPVVLSIICLVYLSQEDLPSTLTKVYDAFTCEKLLLNAQDSQADSVLHLPDDHDFYQLCNIAYSCVVEQKVIFTLEELKGLSTRYSNRECGCGLLTARPVGALKNRALAVDSFYYIHLTVQEYLGGIDISRQDIELQKEIWAKYLGQPHMAQVWKFFCGISHLENFDAQYLTSKLQDKEVLVQSLYESQNDDLTSTAMQYAFTDSAEVKPRSPYSAVAYGYCLKQHRSMKKLTVVCRKDIRVRLGNLLSPVLQTASALDLTLSKCHPKDWIEVTKSLRSVEEGEQNAADNREEAAQSLTRSCKEQDDMKPEP